MIASVGIRVFRGLLWGLLLAALVLLAVVTLQQRRDRAAAGEAPPVLAELPAFTLTERSGDAVGSSDLAGAPWVADFIFTRCAGPCPLMSARMAKLGERLPDEVRRVSFSVDPDYDTPQVLRAYAERYQAGPDWLFLTGERDAIYRLSIEGFRLGVAAADEAPEEVVVEQHGDILHSTRFVLVDGDGRIRGYYDAFESGELDRLVADASKLRLNRTGDSRSPAIK